MASSSSNPPPLNQHLDEPTHHHLARIPAIPDLRFEYSYLRSIRPYVKVMRTAPGSASVHKQGPIVESGYEIVSDKGKEKDTSPPSSVSSEEVALLQPTETIQIQWGNVLWVTTRDQIITPFLQGALWGTASYFIMPLLGRARNRLARYFVSSRLKPKTGEGKGVSSLRGWVKGLNATSPQL